jgi:hypothetical protein
VTTRGPAKWLDAEARKFGDDIGDLLARTLPGAPGMHVDVVREKLLINPIGQYVDDKGKEHGGIPLRVNGGVELAWLRVSYICRPDSQHKHLAVAGSRFWVVSYRDRSPLIRFEYLYSARTDPCSHIQVHAERGAFSHLLSRTGHKQAHELSKLHLPTGGARFRPGLEDVLQFLIADCRFKPVKGWKDAVEEHRARWRAIQTRAVTRDMAVHAAAELRDLGYTVIPPEDGEPKPNDKAQHTW